MSKIKTVLAVLVKCEDTLLSEQPYRYLTVDEMKSLGDDSLPIDVRQDERVDSNRECMTVPPTAVDDTISPQHLKEAYSQFTTPDNIDISKHTMHVGFLVSFLVDARGGAMRGCRHSGVRVIVPPRRASMPMRVTCRYLKRDKLSHPPPLMEGEALASRILELGPVGAKFLGPVMIEVPHFGSLRGKEREIVILRSDNGETWREHTVDCSEEAVQDVLSHSFDKEDLAQLDENARTTRILTTDFPHYFAVVTRVRQEVHAIGPEGGMVSSSVVPQVQAVFPQGALTKKIKVGLQAQPISAELAAKLLGNRVAVSPIVTVEPRRRKFHKPITLTIPKPQAANKGMINQYSGDAPTLRLLCSITGGTTRAQWEDVTGSTPFTFVNDCVSFTTTVSARFWLMDCRNVGDATKMATELYREAIHVPFMAKFVVFAKRVDPLEARLRIFCMTDDKEDKTLEHQEHFTEVAKSRDVEVLEGKVQYVEFAGNLIPVTKSGEQLQLGFRAFRENRLPFTVRVKDQHADCVGRTLFMREARLPKGEPPQQPICVLNIVLPDEIIPEAILPEHELHKYSFIQDSSGLESYKRVDLRLSDISNLLGADWVQLADELGVAPSDINRLKSEHPHSVAQQGLAMLRLWVSQAGNKAQASTLESALSRLGRDDIVQQCVFNVDQSSLHLLKDESLDASIRRSIPYSDNDFMKDSESVEDLSRTSLQKTGYVVEKDDKEERKYEAEEKEIEEVRKSVSERRKEIEKRLSLDKPLEKKIESIDEKTSLERDDLFEKEIAEEKRVSSPEEEPSELSFEQKRLSFEQGKRVIEMKPDKTTMKEVKERADERFLAEERKVAEALQDKKSTSMVEETSIPFHEKRKSFEKGLKEEKATEKKEDSKKEDLRKDTVLFEGVSQGLVRLDAAFTAAPQVQDLLSPKVSKTPPPSPAEFKDLTGTVAWTEESAADVPVKAAQSQDWAEKGKPDPTIDLSTKESSSKCIEDKESKYQFTMTVPDKNSFSDTLSSITTFLESEKEYNNQMFTIDPNRLTAVADTEVSSSDEAEECQSRSESDLKSDKSFMGKMSKKLFGVFKKDEKSQKNKGKKKKHKNESHSNDSSHPQNCENVQLFTSSNIPEQIITSENLSIGTCDGIEHTPKTKTDHEQKLRITVRGNNDNVVPASDSKLIFDEKQTHNQIKDATDTLVEVARKILSKGEENVSKTEDYTVREQPNDQVIGKSNKEINLEITPANIISEEDKLVYDGKTSRKIEHIEMPKTAVDAKQSDFENSKLCEDMINPISTTNDKHVTKEVELLQPLCILPVSRDINKQSNEENSTLNDHYVESGVIPTDLEFESKEEKGSAITEKRKVKFSSDAADEVKKTSEDVKRKAIGVTFALDFAPDDNTPRTNISVKDTNNVVGENVINNSKEEISKIFGQSIVNLKSSADDSIVCTTEQDLEEKPIDKDIPSKGTKEKKKSLFGSLFSKSGEILKIKKVEAVDTIDKNQSGGNYISECSENTTESKISGNKVVNDVKDMEELLHGKDKEVVERNIEEKGIKNDNIDKDETTQSLYGPQNTTCKANGSNEEDVNITTSINHESKKIKPPKEKGKYFFSGIFGKGEDVADTSKFQIDNTSLSHFDNIHEEKSISADEDSNIESINVFALDLNPSVSLQINDISQTSGVIDMAKGETGEYQKDFVITETNNTPYISPRTSTINVESYETHLIVDTGTKEITDQVASMNAECISVLPSTTHVDEKINNELRSSNSIKNIAPFKAEISNKFLSGNSEGNPESIESYSEVRQLNFSENIEDRGNSYIIPSNSSNMAEQAAIKNQNIVDHTILHLSNNFRENDKKSAIGKDLIKISENVIPSLKNKVTDVTTHVSEISADTLDKTGTILFTTVLSEGQMLEEVKVNVTEALTSAEESIPSTGYLPSLSFDDVKKIDRTSFVDEPFLKENESQDNTSINKNRLNPFCEIKCIEANASDVSQDSCNEPDRMLSYFESGVITPFQKATEEVQIFSEDVNTGVIQANVPPIYCEKDKTEFTLDSLTSSSKEILDNSNSSSIKSTNEVTNLTERTGPTFCSRTDNKMFEVESDVESNMNFEHSEGTINMIKENVEDVQDYVSNSALPTYELSGTFDLANSKVSDCNNSPSKRMYDANIKSALFGFAIEQNQIKSSETPINPEEILNNDKTKHTGKPCSEINEKLPIFTNIELKPQELSIQHSTKQFAEDTLSNFKDQGKHTDKLEPHEKHPVTHSRINNEHYVLQCVQEHSDKLSSGKLNQGITEKGVQEVSDSSKCNDDKLNKILIDMLIEQEGITNPSSSATESLKLDADQPPITEEHIPKKLSAESPENKVKDATYKVLKGVSSYGKIESLIKDIDLAKSQQNNSTPEPCIVTTPTMQRRKIGGSQRLSREERPALRDVSHIIDYSSSEEDETNYYIVTEPSDWSPQKKVVFHVESEDESFVKISDTSSEPEVEFTEISPSPDPSLKKQRHELVEENAACFVERVQSNIDTEKNMQKVERRFERMASETLEADPVAKYATDREFQRMVSQLSNEEVDACLSQWEEGGLTPSEELDSSKDTVEGDIDPDLEALPEASIESTNPFYSTSSKWLDFDHDINDVPSSIFWAFDTMPTSTIIQQHQLDIPIKPMPNKGESTGEEASKSPVPTSVREGEEALLDLATGLHDAKGSSSGSGPSSAK